MSNFKTPSWRSKAYRVWVASFPCLGCGAQAYTAHHHVHPDIEGRGGKGAGRKADDMWTVPVCAHCHAYVHQRGFFERHKGQGAAGLTQQAVLVQQAELMAKWVAGGQEE